jgi:hypothetical protein
MRAAGYARITQESDNRGLALVHHGPCWCVHMRTCPITGQCTGCSLHGLWGKRGREGLGGAGPLSAEAQQVGTHYLQKRQIALTAQHD